MAPELAELVALASPVASPVSPESPESPEVASPPTARAVPRMAVLAAVALTLAGPVVPVAPELPETPTGLAVADEEASPVSPVLVALDCDVLAPEAPLVAVGVAVTLAAPPAPPSASAVATVLPPLARTEPPDADPEEAVERHRRRRR